MVGAPAKQRRGTLATVAASVGVSIATVSKVLNGRDDVASATRALVQEALQQHDYAASAPRRSEAEAHPTVEVEVEGDGLVVGVLVRRCVVRRDAGVRGPFDLAADLASVSFG